MDLCGATLEELRAWMGKQGRRPFHADQIIQWVYKKHVHDFATMSDLDKGLRTFLAAELQFPLLSCVRKVVSKDGETVKFLWKLRDGQLVESVLILSGERRTVCVSSQVGCRARCAFCASGKEGWKRDLSAAEIVEQVLLIDAYLAEKSERVCHVVYMGMGEPLENVSNVIQSIRLLNDPRLLGISMRRITVSTVGVVEGIMRLLEEGIRVNLALSLHAPNQTVRKKLIPYARRYELPVILRAVDDYAETTGRDITFEYTLIAGINDQTSHAAELAELIDGRQCTVNLIPYNPIDAVRLSRPSRDAIGDFRRVLDEKGVVHTCRYTKGDDIAAACGQLALHSDRELANASV